MRAYTSIALVFAGIVSGSAFMEPWVDSFAGIAAESQSAGPGVIHAPATADAAVADRYLLGNAGQSKIEPVAEQTLKTTVQNDLNSPGREQDLSQKTISGEILSTSNEKIGDAHVYVVAGEEETLSLVDGKFELKTWQPLPLVLTVEHKSFRKQEMILNVIKGTVRITLRKKED